MPTSPSPACSRPFSPASQSARCATSTVPRITYTLLLAFGSIPVFGIAFAWDYTSFLVFRLLIGIIGASFVITQFHTSVMFAPNVVGTANATVGGWG